MLLEESEMKFSIGDLIIRNNIPGMIIKMDRAYLYVKYPSITMKEKVYYNRSQREFNSGYGAILDNTTPAIDAWDRCELVFRKQNLARDVKNRLFILKKRKYDDKLRTI